jgi:filamentous hemagglutinin family protein
VIYSIIVIIRNIVSVVSKLSRLSWLLGIGMSGVSAFSSYTTVAQITPDGTLGTESSVVTPNVDINGTPSDRIDGGATRGSNLFHSFEQFNVEENRGAYFSNPSGIENIITRVTGGSASNINGTLGVLGSANLFFINPNGIIFGRNARLEVGGSFVGSTASGIQFGEQGFFRATNPDASTALLTINPTALFFNQVAARASIESKSNLNITDGQSLLLVGGKINIDGGKLNALGSQVELGGLADTGAVSLSVSGNIFSLNFPDNIALADVSLINGAEINVASDGGGSIVINARHIDILGRSGLRAGIRPLSQRGGTQAGDVTLNATETIRIEDGFIYNVVFGTGNGGNIGINTRQLMIEDGVVATATVAPGDAGDVFVNATESVQLISSATSNGTLPVNIPIPAINDPIAVVPIGLLSSSFNASDIVRDINPILANFLPQFGGDVGNLTIETGRLLVRNGAEVSTSTFGAGKAGNLTVNADTVEVIGSSSRGTRSRITAQVNSNATGDGGELKITTGTLLVRDGGLVVAGTFGEGNGGNLTVSADTVELSGVNSVDNSASGLFNQAGTGSAGNLTIDTSRLLVRDGAGVGASTFGAGNAGNLTVKADTIELIGSNAASGNPSNLSATAANRNSTGSAGNLTIDTLTLLVSDGAEVNASTFGAGKAGNLTVNADRVGVIGSSSRGTRSRITAQVNSNATGDGGELRITAGTLLVRDGGLVVAGTFGEGNGGNLTVSADTVELSGVNSVDNSASGLFNQAGTGSAGNLTIDTSRLLVRDGAGVGASTFGAGNAGNLTVKADTIELIGSNAASGNPSNLSARAANRNSTGSAGNLTIDTLTLLVSDGAEVNASTFGAGKAGNLTVNADRVEVTGSSISAQVNSNATGDGGVLRITTGKLLVSDGGQVRVSTFGSGNGGNLTVSADTIEVIGVNPVDSQIPSGLFASAEPIATGSAGDLTIDTQTLLVQDKAEVSVQALGAETAAGNMTLNARFIRLDDNAVITANTKSAQVDSNTEQATININSQNLIMTDNSNFRTNATGENVIGGNININTDFLIAFDNSDITANSANSRGGNVQINAQGVFGIEARQLESDETNDITATGANSELAGTIVFNVPDIEPTQGQVQPPELVNTDNLIANSCIARTNRQVEGTFFITGSGGLPYRPGERGISQYTTGRPRRVSNTSLESNSTSRPWRKGDPIVEPSGVFRLPSGRVVLSRECSDS